jgi:hypothetical protein
MFEIDCCTAKDYHELNAGAHRKAPKVLSAPSLVWHLAFWVNFTEVGGNDKPPTAGEGDQKKRALDEVRLAIDSYIIALLRSRDANARLTPCIYGACLLFKNAYDERSLEPVRRSDLKRRQLDMLDSTVRAVTLQFSWRKLDVSIRFEVRSEYFTVSTFVELDRDRSKENDPNGFSDIPDLNSCLQETGKYLKGAPADPTSGVDETAPRLWTPAGDELEGRINRYVFHDFWTTYRMEVLQDQTLTAYQDNPIFGHIFADFRGLIASDQTVKLADDGFFRDGKPPSWGGEAKKRFLPLIQHRNRAEHSRHECAVNYLLDGRALYMSTLGPHLPSIPEAHRIPVEFIVYAHVHPGQTTIVNKWQLGRVVSQILLLGTLRLCALKDLKWLHEAGQRLGSLEESTQSARKAIAATEIVSSGSEPQGAAERQKSSREAMARIAEAHSKLNGITGDFLKETGDGPLYRIERSRYYVQQFEENIKLLRIKRLEGDQPYDQFIRRRLGSEFDFINRLGIRYERAASSIVTLDQIYLAITQNALVERATKIDEDTMSIQSEIRKIQEWGEFALLAALVPYYVTHLLDLIINEQYVPGLTAGVWWVFGVIAIYRMFKNVGYAAILGLATVPIVLAVAWPGLAGARFGGILRTYEAADTQHATQKEILDVQKKLQELGNEQLAVLKELRGLRQPDRPNADQPSVEPDDRKR